MRNSAQYALDCVKKHLEIKNFSDLDPFTVKKNCQILNPPPPLTEKLDPPLCILDPDHPQKLLDCSLAQDTNLEEKSESGS